MPKLRMYFTCPDCGGRDFNIMVYQDESSGTPVRLTDSDIIGVMCKKCHAEIDADLTKGNPFKRD